MREFIRDLMQKEGLNEEISSKILKILQTHENGGNIPEYLGQVYEEIMQKIDIKKWDFRVSFFLLLYTCVIF